MGLIHLLLRSMKMGALMLTTTTIILASLLYILSSIGSPSSRYVARMRTPVTAPSARFSREKTEHIFRRFTHWDRPWKHHQRVAGDNSDTILQKLDVSPNSSWVVLQGNVVVHQGVESNPHDYAYILSSEGVCESLKPNRTSLVIFVASDVRHIKRRKTIRDTWALRLLQLALNYRVVFMLGRSLTNGTQQLVLDEYYRYGDIVQEDFTESFRNLTLKSVMGLKWVFKTCENADYVMKTDDDIFIHVPNLMRLLVHQGRKKSLLLCHRNRVRTIVREQHTMHFKYKVKSEQLPGAFFPQYCAGFGYAMSRSVVEKLYAAALTTPYFFIEDVFVTGFCRQKAGVRIVDHHAFTMRPYLTPAQANCEFRQNRVTSQELDMEQMREMWEHVNMKDYFCPRPIGLL